MHSALVEQEVPGWAAALVVTSPTRAVVADSETRLVAVMSTVVASVVKSMPEVVRVTEVTKDVSAVVMSDAAGIVTVAVVEELRRHGPAAAPEIERAAIKPAARLVKIIIIKDWNE